MEKPLFYRSKRRKLFGVMHVPEPQTASVGVEPAATGIILCAPFGEEKLISHRVLVNLARTLASRGYPCFRFDFFGHGDSEGRFEEATIESRLDDIDATTAFFRQQARLRTHVLLGVRFGATLALLAAQRSMDCKELILIAPLMNGKAYFEQLLRSNLATQMRLHKKIVHDRRALINELEQSRLVNVDGYRLSRQLYAEMAMISLDENSDLVFERALVVHVARKEGSGLPAPVSRFVLTQRNEGRTVETRCVVGDDFWKESMKYDPWQNDIQGAVVDYLSSRGHPEV